MRYPHLTGMDPERHAFTLIELLVVIAITAILAALILSGFSGAKEQANITRCSGNLRNIGQAISLYASENNSCLPSVIDPRGTPWDATLLPYLGNSSRIFHCPNDPWPSPTPSQYPRSYAANGGVAYGVAPTYLPFGELWKDNTNRLNNLTPSGNRLILIGERPGDSAVNRGLVGYFAFCSLDVIPGTLHHGKKGGMYLFADLGVEYLTFQQVAEGNYWYMKFE